MFLERGNDNLTYDPQVDGYTSGVFWTTLVGTPAISGTVLRMNAASMYSVSRLTADLDMEFKLTIPASPVGGHARKWGMFLPSMGNKGAVYFEVADTVFRVRAYDNDGTTLLVDHVIAWDPALWTGQPIRYRIRKTFRSAEFFIEDVSYCQQAMVDPIPLVKTVNIPLAIAVDNGVADNVDMTYLMIRGVSNLS